MNKYTAQRQEELPAWELGDISTPLKAGDMDTSKRNLLSNEEEIRDEERKGKGKRKYSKITTFPLTLTSKSSTQAKPTGWKAGIRWCILAVSICFIINLILTITAATHSSTLSGIGTLYTGSCTKASRINSACHVFINILSTALLGCSNYVMQCLGAPTRDMVDKAHARGKALDVGVPSYGNLLSVGWRRAGLFAVLWVSSFPLHFFWNSVVFSTLQSNEFVVLAVASDFRTGPFACDERFMAWSDPDSDQISGMVDCSVAEGFYNGVKTPGAWEQLDNKACMEDYSASFLSGRRNLLLVSNTTRAEFDTTYQSNSSTFGVLNSTSWNQRLGMDWLADGWLCKYAGSQYLDQILETGQSCSTSTMTSHAQDWEISLANGTFPVQYCLSEIEPEECKVQSLLVILLGVTCLNLCKLACMIYGTLVMDDKPLMVLGDAAASFLQRPVQETVGRCLWSGRDFQRTMFQRIRHVFRKRRTQVPPEPKVWSAKRHRWFRAAPFSNWFWYFVCSGVSLFVLSAATGQSLASDTASNRSIIFNTPIGSATSSTAFELLPGVDTASSDFATLINVAMAANSPQVLFVFFYYMSNRLLTFMLSADEWSRFSFRRRSLRVSYPTGQQRSTYWLQLPYRYSIPLLIVATLTHFFISESLFVVRVWIYDWQGNIAGGYAFGEGGPLNNTMGYSAKAIITSLSFMFVILLVVTGMGFRRYHMGLPLAGNSSLAISAACHPPIEDGNAAEEKVMWGAVVYEEGTRPGHCCLTSLQVEMPIAGNLYAGNYTEAELRYRP